MKQEEQELLIKEICARLPYGVIAKVYSYWNKEYFDDKLLGIDLEENDVLAVALPGGRCEIDLVKPYLRPMSSMTEEEKKEFDDFCVIDEEAWMKKSITGFINQSIIMSNGIDWLNANHFDYRELIPKGLALPAPEGMYN